MSCWHGGLLLGPLLGARADRDRAYRKLVPPSYVKPYVKRGKNESADAAAISRGGDTTDDAVRGSEGPGQQAVLMLPRTRALLTRQRTMTVKGHCHVNLLSVGKR